MVMKLQRSSPNQDPINYDNKTPLQRDPSNLDTIGPEENVLIREVSFFVEEYTNLVHVHVYTLCLGG